MKYISLSIIVLAFLFSSCSRNKSGQSSRTIGWDYEDMQVFGFNDPSQKDQMTGPGLVFVEGGTFTMGRLSEDVMKEWNNSPRRVTVHSFYIDETEVTNYDYRQYLSWLRSVYPSKFEKYESALPDTLVWRSALAYNEPFVNNYLRHPAYNNYPVVGVNWIQANEYCKWRTDRVNEYILVQNGFLAIDSSQVDGNVFTTEGYLAGNYTGKPGTTNEKANWESGLLLPNYRLPTEAEWEYSALGLVGATEDEMLTNKRIYPWEGESLRYSDKDRRGQMRANFTRGRGDLMGMAGALNDGADITTDVFAYDPNDNGIYNMAGNVNEWVADVYRPLSPFDVEEFQPYRGNVITEYRKDENGRTLFDEYGQAIKDTIADYRNTRDGDYMSNINISSNWNNDRPSVANNDSTTNQMYVQNTNAGLINSFISDRVRVYKGGSFLDRAYWLNPGSRRYLKETEAKNDLGFRCAMTHLGPPKKK